MQPSDSAARDSYRRALDSALRILAHRDHTETELGRKLDRRGYGQDLVRRVIEECRRYGYLDDDRAARQLLEQMKRRGLGIRRIRFEMVKKGLTGPGISELLRESLPAGEELERAHQAVGKRAAAFDREPDAQRRKVRIQRFLHSRGFTDSVIFELLRET